MLTLEYIDTVKFGAGGRPQCFFILGDMDCIQHSDIVIFGTGIEAYMTFNYLSKIGLKDSVKYFLNNDYGMKGLCFCEKKILHPVDVLDMGYYVIIAMSKQQYLNEVLWQLKVHNKTEYAVAFLETYHVFCEQGGEPSQLQAYAIRVINKILCEGKTINEIIKPTVNVGPRENIMMSIIDLCWTTTWSHCVLSWFFEEYSQYHMGNKLELLEIGPGRGFFSAVVAMINPDINIEWLMFEMDEMSAYPVKGKYNWWPASDYKTYYGMIEDPEFVIDKKFDIIVMTEVMEHFSTNPQRAVNKIVNMLKPDGKLYLSTPAWGHVPIYETYNDIPDFSSKEKYKNNYIGHAYQYSKQELESIFQKCGMTIQKYAVSEGKNHNVIIVHT